MLAALLVATLAQVSGEPLLSAAWPPAALKESATPAGAGAAFDALEPGHREFLGQWFPADPKRLGATYAKAKETVHARASKYLAVFDLAAPRWSMAALVRAGEEDWHLAQMLERVPAPPEVRRLGDEAVAAYLEQLAGQSRDLKQRARAHWQRAQSLSRELKVACPELEAIRSKL